MNKAILRNCIKTELRKALGNYLFWLSLAIASGIAIWSALQNISAANEYYSFIDSLQTTSGIVKNPEYASVTLFNSWIGQDYTAVATTLFFTLLPILCVLPYSWSFFSERRSGYIRQIVSRSSRKTYFLSKYIATFTAGALVILIPMLLNFMLVSSFIPAISPNINYDIYYNVPSANMGAELFYSQPFFFVLMRMFTAALYAGLIATSVISLSFFVKNRFAVLLIPFLALLVLNYFSEALVVKYGIEISPLDFLGGTSLGIVKTSVVALFALLVFVFSFGITLGKGVRSDVF